MRTLAALEIDLAKARHEFHVLRERNDKATCNILSQEMSKVLRRITNLHYNINQRKQKNL